MGEPIEFPGFCEPAYKLETPNAASSEMINCYLERIERGPRAGKMRIRSVPGLKPFCTLDDAPVRGLLAADSGNSLFAVGGGHYYQIHSDGTFDKSADTIAINDHPVLMALNGFQVAIASGGLGYISGGGVTITPLTYASGPPLDIATIDFLDTYFIGNKTNSRQVFISNPAPDGNIWDDDDTAFKEGYPDAISRVFSDNQQVWIFGFDTAEPWIDTGAVFPFERQGVVVKVGCSAPYSVAGVAGIHFWLWNGAIYAAQGVTPERISDFGIERAILGYGGVSGAEAFCYLDGGHLFYQIRFPGKATWVYDFNVKAWHRRGYWHNGAYQEHRGRVYAKAFGKHLIGDWETGDIYELDPNTYTDKGGDPLRRQRTCDYLTDNMRNLRYNRLIMDMDTGVGLSVGPTEPGYDPQLIMRYSPDRGKTWSNDRQMSMGTGQVGDTIKRVIYNQLGSSRLGMTFDVVCSDPVPFSVNGAYLTLGQSVGGR